MVNRKTLLALGNGPIVAVSLLLMLHPGSVYAEFESKAEYRSIIDTDPEIGQQFSRLFLGMNKPQVDRVAEGVFLARGFGQGNAVMLEGEDGIVIFDVGDSYEHGKAMLAAFREYTAKPIKAVIYSHYHFDHVFGCKAWVEAADEDVQIIAHESTVRYLNERVSALAPRTDWGLAMQFGLFLDEDCEVGEGPLCSGVKGIQFPRIGSVKGHKRHVIYPNRTFRDRLALDVAGLEIELIHSPSETPDNILLWFPEKKTILTGDSLTPTLPPIFTARGQRVRDPEGYLESIDLMRSLQPEHVVPSHGPAFSGQLAQQVLVNYRDAVAFMYHQTVRLINRGLGPEEIASRLRLRPHLANHPLLGQWYNDLQTDIRGIYGYLVGHYHDVAEMPLLSPEVADLNMIALAGGPEPYLQKLQEAYDRGDHVWVARAATHLIRMEPDNQAAKDLKAAALRVLAARTIAGSHRHFYLQHAAALEGLIEIPMVARFAADDVSTVPVASLIKQLPFRLNAERAVGHQGRFSIAITDSNESFVIEQRNGVAEVLSGTGVEPIDISMDSKAFRLFYIGMLSLETGFAEGDMTGNKAQAQSFLELFDWPRQTGIRTSIRR
jgi:alkyl sulfatase BDS1-like metallo-beta-lactamase superfamily hydrolase